MTAVFLAILVPACDRESPPADFAERVRLSYTGPDVDPFAAWDALGTPVPHLAVAVRSVPPVEPLLRFEFWAQDVDGEPFMYGRSEPFRNVSDADVVVYRDINGDGVPDLMGTVFDSLGLSQPVLIFAGLGEVSDELETVAPDWRFDFATPPEPTPCWIKVWVLEPAPDSFPAGWRYLPLTRGSVSGPQALEPPCPTPNPVR